MKIENQSRERSHKLDGIGVGRIRTFPFLPIPFTTPSLMIKLKLGCRSRKQKRKNQPIKRPGIEHCHWFILPLLLATDLRLRQCSFLLIESSLFQRSVSQGAVQKTARAKIKKARREEAKERLWENLTKGQTKVRGTKIEIFREHVSKKG